MQNSSIRKYRVTAIYHFFIASQIIIIIIIIIIIGLTALGGPWPS
jgi:hypothetical protein